MGNKHSGTAHFSLKQLAKNVHFKTEELMEMRTKFFAIASKIEYKSEINRSQFEEALATVNVEIQNKAFLDRLFDIFDRENDGLVNFKEFVTGLSLVLKGTHDEKVKVCFEVYDLDHTGLISKKEMYQVLKAINSTLQLVSEDGSTLTKEEIKDFVDDVFANSDVTGNDKLSF